MKVKDVMTPHAEYITADTSLEEAAKKMATLHTGFLPIADDQQQKLEGVITDRDIVLRAVANGLDCKKTSVHEVRSDKVLYCFQDDDLEKAADSMAEQKVYRLVVLDNPDSKQLAGILTLGDLGRHHVESLMAKTAADITSAAA